MSPWPWIGQWSEAWSGPWCSRSSTGRYAGSYVLASRVRHKNRHSLMANSENTSHSIDVRQNGSVFKVADGSSQLGARLPRREFRLAGFMLAAIVLVFASATTDGLHGQELADDFFEKHVRPLLVTHCVECHGPDQQEAGVRLDSRQALMGEDEGTPLLDPTDWAASRLLQVISYEHDVQMPPAGRLEDQSLEHLRQWVMAGAPWPATAVIGSPMEQRLVVDRQEHWAFQPIQRQFPGLEANANRHPIDVLLQKQRDAVGLSASEIADDKTRLRRLYLTLIGLPPTTDELAAFMADDRPERWTQVVDDLLAREQYGERWARHWLDVARYADTQGYAFAQDRRYPHAYTYRDYVVNSFNSDLPYDQFVMQQLAADQLDLGEDLTPLAGLGFLTVGRRFIDNNDTLDDRIDVVTRGLLGLTVSCARCHDHKYDAITAADYYALYGVMASSPDPEVKPPIGPKSQVEARQAFDEGLRQRRGELQNFRAERQKSLKQATIDRLHDYILAVYVTPPGMDLSKADDRVSLQPEDLRPKMVARWRDQLKQFRESRGPAGKWFAALDPLMSLSDAEGASAFQEKIEQWKQVQEGAELEGVERLDSKLWARLQAAGLDSKAAVAKFYADLLREVWTTFQDNGANDRAVLKVDESLRFAIEIYRNDGTPLNLTHQEIGLYLNDDDYAVMEGQLADINAYESGAPPELPRAMTVVERQPPVQPYVFLRGNPNNRGPEVPRRFLTVLSKTEPEPFPADSSGRLQLAQKIVEPDNPLTARVIVNRVWMHHFGTPLVATPSDFGVRCEEPRQRELLDFLANYLQSSGWSLKALHRLILTSNAFQQASRSRTDGLEKDPENQTYWRMNRRRMEWEALRDSMLAVTGQIDLTLGGPAIDLFRSQASNRRSLYGTIDRQDLPNLLRSFDFASPDTSSAVRPQTTVPQQSLFLMNGPLVMDLAEKVVRGAEFQALDLPEQQVQWLFQRFYLRSASETELIRCLEFVAAGLNVSLDDGGQVDEQGLAELEEQRWKLLTQAMLMSNEFCFFD